MCVCVSVWVGLRAQEQLPPHRVQWSFDTNDVKLSFLAAFGWCIRIRRSFGYGARWTLVHLLSAPQRQLHVCVCLRVQILCVCVCVRRFNCLFGCLFGCWPNDASLLICGRHCFALSLSRALSFKQRTYRNLFRVRRRHRCISLFMFCIQMQGIRLSAGEWESIRLRESSQCRWIVDGLLQPFC